MRALVAGLTAFLFVACQTTGQSAGCDSACRIALAMTFATTPTAISANAKITENGATLAPAALWLNGATNLNFHAFQADADGANAIIAGTGTGADGKPAVFGLRTEIRDNAATGVELIVTRAGEVSLFPSAIPLKRQTIFDEIVPANQRTAPDQMVAAANAYLDGIEASDGSKVPVTEDCQRVENGVQTTNSARYGALGCNSLSAFVYIPEVRERRFPIVDTERGVVVSAIAFYIPGGDYERVINGEKTTRHYDPRSLFLFETFKIIDGRIAFIEATMRNMPLGTSMGW